MIIECAIVVVGALIVETDVYSLICLKRRITKADRLIKVLDDPKNKTWGDMFREAAKCKSEPPKWKPVLVRIGARKDEWLLC